MGPAPLPEVVLAALEQTRAAACITTADLDEPGPTIVYVNPAYCAMTGWRREEVVGRTPRVMQGPLTDRSTLDRLRADLSSNRRFDGETVNYRSDGTPFIISWSIDPVRDTSGVTTHFIATQEDVTDRVRNRRLIEAERLVDASLTRLLNDPGTAGTSLSAFVETVADAAAIVAPSAAVNVFISDEDQGVAGASGPVAQVGARLVIELGRARSRIAGQIELSGLTEAEKAFLDVDGLGQLAHRTTTNAAALLEYHRQRAAALRLQQAMLPDPWPAAKGFELLAIYEPASLGMQVGGDWYDVCEVDGRLVLSVGDVAGHGIEAAALMGQLRVAAQVELRRGAAAIDVLHLLDRIVRDQRNMATMLVAEIDSAARSVCLHSAGHLPPVVFGPTGSHIIDVEPLPPLGFVGDRTVAGHRVDFDDEDGLLMFTDGFVERRGEDLDVSLERLASAIPAAGALAGVVGAVRRSAPPVGTDDVAVLAVRRARG